LILALFTTTELVIILYRMRASDQRAKERVVGLLVVGLFALQMT